MSRSLAFFGREFLLDRKFELVTFAAFECSILLGKSCNKDGICSGISCFICGGAIEIGFIGQLEGIVVGGVELTGRITCCW